MWAQVTYHVLTRPITTKQRPQSGSHNINVDVNSDLAVHQTNVRVEALRCTGDGATVALPDKYKSPLAKNFRYYISDNITKSELVQLYGYNDTKYYTYTIKDGNGNPSTGNADVDASTIAPGSAIPSGCTDIYVTCEYDETQTILDLTGNKLYNIEMDMMTGAKTIRFLCLNKDRNNRPGGMQLSKISATLDYLSSDGFSYIRDGVVSGKHNYHFIFKFLGTDNYDVSTNTMGTAEIDPYNITIMTGLKGHDTFQETDKNLNKSVYKEFRGATIFAQLVNGASNSSNMWLSSDTHTQWQEGGSSGNAIGKEVPGYFRGTNSNRNTHSEMTPIFNSFVLLGHTSGTGYAFAATKINVNGNNWQPNSSSKNDVYLYNDGDNNVRANYKKDSETDKIFFHEVKQYHFIITTPFGNTVTADGQVSAYMADRSIQTSDVPESLRRKYCGFVGFYSDAALTMPVTKYSDVPSNNNIYVKYEVSGLPFQTLPIGGSYADATWYTMKKKDSTPLVGLSNDQFVTDEANTISNTDTHFAFMGDPYELKILNRYACNLSTPQNRYVGFTTDATDQTLTYGLSVEPTVASWEIEPGTTEGYITLRGFNRGTPFYWYWGEGNNQSVQYKSEKVLIRVEILPVANYTYIIVDKAGNKAIAATAEQTIYSSLSYTSIPAVIRSPFLSDETLTFYSTYSSPQNSRTQLSGIITQTPATDATIYVKYTTSHLASKNIRLNADDATQQFNVKLNGNYIYWDETQNKICSSADPGIDSDTGNSYLLNPKYLWYLRGRDPYALLIDNIAARTTFDNEEVTVYDDDGNTTSESKSPGAWVRVDGGTWGDDKALELVADRTQASRFIAMMGNNVGVYEMMAATGTTDYYHIGRATGNDTDTKLYSINTTGYAHGNDALRFELATIVTVVYHLIDQSGNEIFEGEIFSRNPRLALPEDFVSPLVAEYYYYRSFGEAIDNLSEYRITEVSDATTDVDNTKHVYVRYKVGDLVEYNIGNKMYRLKFDDGDTFHQEDGHDHMNATAQKAIYPYCNGDCNFFVYGSEQLLEQMGGAASTRTRWAWYIESANSDPYHVKIVSRQQEPDANNVYQRMYFRTYVVNYDNVNHVVTGITTPGVTEIQGTDYMVLGQAHHYLLTTVDKIDDGIENKRRTVTSFEQYWKTWETITNRGSSISDAGVVEGYQLAFSENVTQETRTAVENGLHSYIAWAKSRPIQKTSASKRFARETHYYHTVNMGNGTFDFEEMQVVPVLVLLDQHGWEIMRKPLPTGELDGSREAKLNAIRPYNSPMVEKYIFWAKSSKRSGYHQYYNLQNAVEYNGSAYTTNDLTALPPYNAKNVKDSYGDLQDLYITYTVKEEYTKSYDPGSKTGQPFIIQQGNHFVDNISGAIHTNDVPGDALGGISKYIIDNIDKLNVGGSKANELWYVKPNPEIDIEMGYEDYIVDWTNDYTGNFSDGFDPYNMQISSLSDNTKYFVTNCSGSTLDEGEMVGAYTDNVVSLGDQKSVSGIGQDNRNLRMTNATFMAVQDANGNMQLMPRFDKNMRITDFCTLDNPQTNAANDKTGTQTTFLIRPLVYEYHIIDNQGREALCYKTAGENYPSIPEHFQSPLAMDFTYYKTAPSYDSETEKLTVTDPITGSFAAAEWLGNTNTVYVRYHYNESNDNDGQRILHGPWLTMSLAGKDVQASGEVDAEDGTGVSLYGTTKPADAATLSTNRQWHWKFLASPSVSTLSDGTPNPYYVAPDPYAIQLFNRKANYDNDPTANPSKMGTAIKVGDSTDRFVILSHPSGDYALAAAGTGLYTYSFLNGDSMTDPDDAVTEEASIKDEANFTTTTNIISNNARVIFSDDITHTYTYHIITNDASGNRMAASEDQNQATAQNNYYIPAVPATIQTPLLNEDDYLFYGTATGIDTYTIDENSQIDNLFGLYDDVVYVRYKAYNPDKTLYRVPNVKTDDSAGHVAKGSGSNDAPIGLGGERPYNIVWFDNNMMLSSDDTSISDAGDHSLDGNAVYVWTFEGDDPYAIKIKHKGSGKYAVGRSDLDASPSKTYMLLKNSDYEYGVLAETGNKSKMLTFGDDDSNGVTPNTLYTITSAPTKFIIFGLSTHKVIYRLVMANIGSYMEIPYAEKENDVRVEKENMRVSGSTHRDLASGTPAGSTYQLGTNMSLFSPSQNVNYCFDAGQISLGDLLSVPTIFKRPNCKYFFYVGGIYNEDACTTLAMSTDATPVTLDSKYKGLEINHMGTDADLLNKTVFVNIIYEFDDGLPTNTGSQFVTSTTGPEWYTFETNGATPWMAHYTYTDAKLSAVAGHDLHYTNDYLWKPEGDPYGFKMYNRYVYKNGGETTKVMNATLSNNANIVMSSPDGNDVYELLPAVADGFFRVSPLKSSTLFVNVDNNGVMRLSSEGIASQWKFGLREDMVSPYFDRAGYVGGLTKEVANAHKNDDLAQKQTLVYGNEASNFVSYSSGYYRLHNMPNSSGINTNRYVSGYTHEIEKTAVSGGIPMHFYESKGTSNITYITLISGFTSTNATRGEIPVSAVEFDPASIFLFDSNNRMKTQGLEVIGNKMTATENGGTQFTIEDIGGAVVTLRDNSSNRSAANYLNYNTSANAYDLKSTTGELADYTKWCMVPANEDGLKVTMNSGGDDHYYATFYAPYDVTITNAEAEAYVCTAWDTNIIYPTSIGKTIPAGTPAIIRSTASGDVVMALSGTATSPISCVFSGEYLEQLLVTETESTVYTFGLPITGLTGPAEDGTLSNVANMHKETTGVGFFINANPNKEVNSSKSLWTRNNRYVLHNKIYYYSSGGGGSRRDTRAIDFVPVVFDFDDENQPDEEQQEGGQMVGNGQAYDLQGRCVATAGQVKDGTWRNGLKPGIYIVNGKKISIGRQ